MRPRAIVPLIAIAALAAAGSGCDDTAPASTTAPEAGVAAPRLAEPVVGIAEPNAWRRTPPPATADEVAARLAALGAQSQRFVVDWSIAEPQAPGAGHEYRFAPFDAMYRADVEHGIRPLLVVLNAPVWAADSGTRPGSFGNNPPTAEHLGDWAAFVGAVARRYPRAIGIEIWNEPNLAGFWGDGSATVRPDPARYAALLEAGYDAVKAANPRMRVIGGALSPTQETTPAGDVSATEFLADALDAGAAAHMDGLSLHPYPGTGGAPRTLQLIDEVGSVRDEHGAAMPLWLTEVGVTTTGPAPDERARAGAPARGDLPLGPPPAGRRRALRPQSDRAAPARRRVRDRLWADAGAARWDPENEARLRGPTTRVPGGAGLRGAMNVGLVHDYLLVMRGAERTFAAIADCWPDGDVNTTIYSRDGTGGRFDRRRIHTSYLQRLGVRQRGFRLLLPLFPSAVERLPVGDCELIVSSSSAFAHGVRPAPGAVHVCYCHTPFRYAWHARGTALAEAPRPLRPALARVLDRIGRWDLEAAGRVTHYVANSRQVQERIARLYGRESVIIHPPVEVDRFTLGEPLDYFLVVTELVAHKRIDVALEAARQAGVPIRIVGTGPELARLRARFEEAEFLGRVDDEELARLYAGARALLVPGVEEFGIAAVEAQAAGRPVIAVGEGGVLETVIDGETGVLLPRGDVGEFAEAMREVDFDRFRGDAIASHAESFSTARFKERLKAEVERALARG